MDHSSQILPSHELIARVRTNEPDAQIPLVDVNGSPGFVARWQPWHGKFRSSARRRRPAGSHPPLAPGARGQDDTLIVPIPMVLLAARTAYTQPRKPHPGGGGFFLLFPGVISPLPHLTPDHINFASPPRVRRARSIGPVGHRKPGPARESVAVRPGTKSSWLQFHHPLAVRARDVRCGCGHTHTLSSRRLRPPPPWIKPQPSDGRGGAWRLREPSIGPTTRGRAQPEPSDFESESPVGGAVD